MNTVFILMAQYGARAIIPIEEVCRDYFAPLTLPKLLQKIAAGDIALPLVRMSGSLKAAKGVHIMDLAAYIDKQRAAAIKEYESFHGTKWIADG
ncbi:pyocin activator PrtN family protein [Burkholderia vietnamiensis]|uniref:pyocin activator PrtN family protein n=1 Tax=Burkholderia vietnamiensis TaxID=60552 RepID=UPI000841CD22|nr:pyocin activator PrtN family protein [Burkholderia vietnamiensis]AOJ13629.1 Pyocin activator protein PrtN [Burkholderia vietnamiensis]